MQAIQRSYLLILVVLSALWLLADPLLSTKYEFFALRDSLVNYTGILGIGAMSVAMILAIRSVRIERLLGGLDKSYRLHKWLGITGFAFAVVHFLLVNVPKLLIGAGRLSEPPPIPPTEQSVAILQFFQEQSWLGEEFGDWGFKAAVVLIVIALLKKIPYRFFFKTHRLFALLFLFLAFHSLVLMKFSYWGTLLGSLMAILMTLGSVAALVSLFGLVGHGRRAVGEIEALHYHEDNSVLKIAIRLKSKWAGHREGQFAFVTFDHGEGAHPFSIASPWTGDGLVAFFVKGLGDYTKTLPETLNEGNLATVEGPYGCFGFETSKARQIWVAAGIGVAPFVSRIKALMNHPDGKTIDLFYSASRSEDEEFTNRLRGASTEANIRLHVIDPAKDGRLTAQRLCEMVHEWQDADFWFCGPTKFGQSLRDDLVAKGLAPGSFHQELFDMR